MEVGLPFPKDLYLVWDCSIFLQRGVTEKSRTDRTLTTSTAFSSSFFLFAGSFSFQFPLVGMLEAAGFSARARILAALNSSCAHFLKYFDAFCACRVETPKLLSRPNVEMLMPMAVTGIRNTVHNVLDPWSPGITYILSERVTEAHADTALKGRRAWE